MSVVERLQPVQIAYHVPDPEAAAHEYARAFGWGPQGDLLKFYRYVRRAADGWDGSERLRRMHT